MNAKQGSDRKNGLRVIAVGLTVLAITLVWSSLMLDQRRGLLITLLCVSLLLVLFGAIVTVMNAPSAEGTSQARRAVQAAVPIVVVAVSAILATALFWISTVRVSLRVDDSPTIDWSAASETDLRVAAIFGIASEQGVSVALDHLQELAADDDEIRARGHGIAHAIGRYAIQNNGYDATVFGECREIFQSGCYHGVLEAYFEGRPDVDAETVAELCSSMVADGRPPIEAIECAHGLGHGLTVRFDFDLGTALERCEFLELETARQECFDGVFMENAVHGMQPRVAGAGDMQDGHGDHAMGEGQASNSNTDRMYRGMFRPDDLTYPCGEFGDRYQRACWAYQYMVVLRLNGDDFVAGFDACDSGPAAGTESCYLGLGKRIGWEYEESDEELIGACSQGDPAQFDACLRGAMEYFMDTEFDAGRASQLCGAAPGDSREPCFRALGSRVGLVTTDRAETETICRVAGDHAAACLAGAESG